MAAHNTTGFALAGGKSTRMGHDKVLAQWKGISLLENALGKLRSVCREVNICTNREELSVYAPVLRDAMDQNGAPIGPLGGIIAALENTTTDWNVFLPVDVPLLPVELLAQMREWAHTRSGISLGCVPYFEGRPQPLCAVYHRDLLPGLRQALANRIYKVSAAMTLADAEQRMIRFDVLEPAAAGWFLNVNTPEDWTRARSFVLQNPNAPDRPVSS